MWRVILGWSLLAFGPATIPSAGAAEDPIRVPQDQPDLQVAVERAQPGDVILLDRGTYPGKVIEPEEVHDITIRGVDRNTVIFNGDDVRKNAIYVEGDGVTLENMTAHNFQGNGFYWAGVEGFTGRYLTVYNVGLYGIYSIQSRGGLFEHSLVSGAADAAFYMEECSPCDTLLTDLTARLSAVGYSGTNASGNVVVKDSRWELNGAGILPNSYDVGIAQPPQRGSDVYWECRSRKRDCRRARQHPAGRVSRHRHRNRRWDRQRRGEQLRGGQRALRHYGLLDHRCRKHLVSRRESDCIQRSLGQWGGGSGLGGRFG